MKNIGSMNQLYKKPIIEAILAYCRKIVTNHHGVLYAESVPGEDSVFHVILPEVQQREKAEQ